MMVCVWARCGWLWRSTTQDACVWVAWVVMIASCVLAQDCGDYFSRKATSQHYDLVLPGYPERYEDYTHCVWLIEVPTGYRVRLVLKELRTRTTSDGTCVDYLEIRDGSSTEPLLYYGCESDGETIVSNNKWMWIKFRADDFGTDKGFAATYSVELNGHPYDHDPVPVCQNRDFECRNKECLTTSYKCDGMNDCGCTGSGCDEHNCGGLDWGLGLKIGIGILVGAVVFCSLFLGIGLVELYMRRRQEEEARLQDEEQKKRRFRRPKKPNSDAKVKTTKDGVQISVPG